MAYSLFYFLLFLGKDQALQRESQTLASAPCSAERNLMIADHVIWKRLVGMYFVCVKQAAVNRKWGFQVRRNM